MKIVQINPLSAASWFLFDTMVETFAKHGHQFVEPADEADIALFDLHTGFSKFDDGLMHRVLRRGIPLIVFDQFEYSNPPEETPVWMGRGSKHDIKWHAENGIEWAVWLDRFLQTGQVKLCFVRRMCSKWIAWPAFCRPFDQVMYPDHDFPAVSKEELCGRPIDVCFIGTQGEWRENICRDLLRTKLKVDVEFVSPRMPHDEWLDRQRQAKLFLSGDGPGDCSDRPYQLICISAMLKFRNYHRLPVPWTHGVDCIEGADLFGNMEAGDEAMIRGILDDPDKLYSIYLNGIKHMRTHNTFEARSEYILHEMAGVGLC